MIGPGGRRVGPGELRGVGGRVGLWRGLGGPGQLRGEVVGMRSSMVGFADFGFCDDRAHVGGGNMGGGWWEGKRIGKGGGVLGEGGREREGEGEGGGKGGNHDPCDT
jgi:hypothetical protein